MGYIFGNHLGEKFKNSTKDTFDLNCIDILTKDPTPEPILEFTDLLLNITFGFKNNQNLYLLNLIPFLTNFLRINFLNPRR